jgi:AcrR family transcriptional regulator
MQPRALAAWEGRALDRSMAAVRDRSSQRARRLVDAARTIASRSGSSAFTVADVAAEAGVPLRTLYRSFTGRDELLLALFEEEAHTGAELMAGRLASIDAPLARVQAYVEGLAALVVTGSGYASLLVQEHLRLGGLYPAELRAALAPLLDLLALELDAAAAAGELRPADAHDVGAVFALILTQVHMVSLLVPGEDPALAASRLWVFCHAALRPDGPTPPTSPKESS